MSVEFLVVWASPALVDLLLRFFTAQELEKENLSLKTQHFSKVLNILNNAKI
jgi:hypothetical protein